MTKKQKGKEKPDHADKFVWKEGDVKVVKKGKGKEPKKEEKP